MSSFLVKSALIVIAVIATLQLLASMKVSNSNGNEFGTPIRLYAEPT